MASDVSWFRIDETTPKNPFILAEVKKAGSLRKLARKLGIHLNQLSKALNKKKCYKITKIKIAKYYGKDTIEIFS